MEANILGLAGYMATKPWDEPVAQDGREPFGSLSAVAWAAGFRVPELGDVDRGSVTDPAAAQVVTSGGSGVRVIRRHLERGELSAASVRCA
jgi:hypothetical protein